jgi:hypothetical protein
MDQVRSGLLVYMLLTTSYGGFQWHPLRLKVKVKIKAVPLSHAGAKGKRSYSSYSFLTSALDGGEWSASRPGRALPPGKGPTVPIG